MYSDKAISALTEFGSEELKQQYLVPSIAGDVLACLAVIEESTRLDLVDNIKTTALPETGI